MYLATLLRRILLILPSPVLLVDVFVNFTPVGENLFRSGTVLAFQAQFDYTIPLPNCYANT